MKKKSFRTMIVLALAAMAAGGFLFLRQSGPQALNAGDKAAAAAPTALGANHSAGSPECTSRVVTAAIREGTVSEKLPAYGQVIPAPGARRIVSVPFESQVVDIFVNAGQKVSRGDPLIEIEPSPATTLEFEQANDAFELEQQEMQQVERRFNLKLATNEQVLQAKQKLEVARTKLENLKKQGIGGKKEFRAGIGGLIKKVDVQQGNIVPAGSPLIEIVAEGLLQVLLGVEPEDIGQARPGLQVLLSRVNVPRAPVVRGRVERLSYQVNPMTRLDDVFVELPSPASFLLGEIVFGQILAGEAHGLIVPRSAVLSENGRPYVFIVGKGIAHKRFVRIVFENAQVYIISGKGVSAGDRVVTLGNYELKDGMAVEARPQPSALDLRKNSPKRDALLLQSANPSAASRRRGADR